MKNLYEILEVSENASKDVIEKVYKVLAKKYHPDLQTTAQEKKIAEEKMKEINEAYSILSDDEKRAKYDQKLRNERIIQENKEKNTINYYPNNSNIYREANNTYTNVNQDEKNNYSNNIYNNTSNEKLNKALKKNQKKLEKQLKRKMEDAYLKAYGDYLRKNGYRVKYRFDYKNIPILLGIITVIIFVGWLLWIIPISHDYMIEVYNENIIIKKLVDIILNILKK